MLKSVIKIGAATVLVVGLHSLLASKAAKKKAIELAGERIRNGLFRPLYNGVAVATFGALAWYAWRLPNRELYRIRGPLAWLMSSVQLFFVLYMAHGAKEVGILRFSGLPNLAAFGTGQRTVPPEPEGQGPVAASPDEMKITGPFRLSRHPLNFGMIPVIWLMPRMNANLFAFNAVTTAYLVLGSLYEEKRLAEAYGRAYTDYQTSGINFFVPSVPGLISHHAQHNGPEIAGSTGTGLPLASHTR